MPLLGKTLWASSEKRKVPGAAYLEAARAVMTRLRDMDAGYNSCPS